MTRWVHVVSADAPLPTVARTLFENGITAVPVLENGVPIGMVHRAGLLAAAANDDSTPLAAADVLDPLPPQIRTSTGVYEAVALLRTSRAQHLLVVDEHGRLAGIVSKGDLLRALVVED